MPTLPVIDLEGVRVGEVEVSETVFAAPVREHLLWEAVRVLRARKRAGTAKVKSRGEIARTKKKMYRQKGTGNARHGNARVNVFRGGGQVHGPRPRAYDLHMNRKAMAGALRSALSLRAQAGDLLVVRSFEGPEIKTKALAAALARLGAPKALLVDEGGNDWLRLSSRNLPSASFLDVRGINVYDILRFPKLVVSEASLRALDARLSGAPTKEEAAA